MTEQAKATLGKRINDILGYISIAGFIIVLLGYSYTAGQNSKRIDNVVTRQNKAEKVIDAMDIKVDEQFKIINSADAKLGLLLDYFNIADSTRHSH